MKFKFKKQEKLEYCGDFGIPLNGHSVLLCLDGNCFIKNESLLDRNSRFNKAFYTNFIDIG